MKNYVYYEYKFIMQYSKLIWRGSRAVSFIIIIYLYPTVLSVPNASKIIFLCKYILIKNFIHMSTQFLSFTSD